MGRTSGWDAYDWIVKKEREGGRSGWTNLMEQKSEKKNDYVTELDARCVNSGIASRTAGLTVHPD